MLALWSILASGPSLAADVSLRTFAKQQLRLATIAYRIGTASANDCPDPQMVTGLLLHDLSAYDPRVRQPVSQAFSLHAGIGVVEVVGDSAADRAGLEVDDEILNMDAVSVEDPSAIKQPRKSYRRLEKFSRALTLALRDGPVRLTLRRSGAIVSKTLPPQLGCGGEISLLKSSRLNAWSDGRRVTITTRMMQQTRSEDELAFVVAHEMAHNMLGHSNYPYRSLFGIRFGGKRQELAADYLAVWLMAQGGYKAKGGIDLLRLIRKRLWWAVSLDHPSFGSRIKVVAGALAAAADSPVLARAHSSASDMLPGPNCHDHLGVRCELEKEPAAVQELSVSPQTMKRDSANSRE